jgi:hypothetical protein
MLSVSTGLSGTHCSSAGSGDREESAPVNLTRNVAASKERIPCKPPPCPVFPTSLTVVKGALIPAASDFVANIDSIPMPLKGIRF